MGFNYGEFWEDLIEDLADPEFREAYIDMSLRFMQEFHEDKLLEDKVQEHYGRTRDTWRDCTGREFFVHKRSVDCDINGCAIHNPSYHPLSDAKQYMRTDKEFLIERICDHGIGHPDPDSASFMASNGWGKAIWIHGCDGCCREDELGSRMRGETDRPKASGWGPHVHRFQWADDGIGHSGSVCECGEMEPDIY